MKLASLKEGGRDGTLVVVNRDMSKAVKVPDIAPTMQAALDNWAHTEPAPYRGLQPPPGRKRRERL